jgi:hypothetical protein
MQANSEHTHTLRWRLLLGGGWSNALECKPVHVRRMWGDGPCSWECPTPSGHMAMGGNHALFALLRQRHLLLILRRLALAYGRSSPVPQLSSITTST